MNLKLKIVKCKVAISHKPLVISFKLVAVVCSLLAAGFLFNPPDVFAKEVTAHTALGDFASLSAYINAAITKYAIPLASIAALLVITFAGFLYVTSAGSSAGIEKAKELIIGAVLGLATLFFIGYVIQVIIPTEELDPNFGYVAPSSPNAATPLVGGTLPTGSATSDLIYQTALKHVGEKNRNFYGAENVACASFVSAVLVEAKIIKKQDTCAAAFRLEEVLDHAYSFDEVLPANTPISSGAIAKVMSGDIIFYNDRNPRNGSNIVHTGIAGNNGMIIDTGGRSTGYTVTERKLGGWGSVNKFQVLRIKTSSTTQTSRSSDDSTDPGEAKVATTTDDPETCAVKKTGLLTTIGSFLNITASADGCSATSYLIKTTALREAVSGLTEDTTTQCGPAKYYDYDCPEEKSEAYRPWCAYFVSWVVRRSGKSDFGVKIAGSEIERYFKNSKNGTTWTSNDPKPGDVFWKSRADLPNNRHVGIVVGVNTKNKTITIVDGNGKKSDGKQKVFKHTLSMAEIQGYGRFK